MKILIEVRGGTIETISTSQDAEIVIIDYDNIDNGQNPVSEISQPDHVYPDFWELFTDEGNPQEMEVRDELKRLKF